MPLWTGDTWNLWFVSGGYELSVLAQTGFVKKGSDLECLHALVGENTENVRISKGEFFFVLWLFCYQRLKLRSPYICNTHESNLPPWVRYSAGAITLRIHYAWEGHNHIHIKLIPPVLCRSNVHTSSSCQSLSLAPAHVPLTRRDLSLGAPPALCCAPLVEEVLVYCLHDLVKYVYMNDD